MPARPESREEEARLTGARAEFAGSLPRRLEVLRASLAAAEEVPSDADRVRGLLRRVHAVGSAARVLGFASVAEALAEAERSVRQASAAGRALPFDDVSRAFDVLPSLVLGASVGARAGEGRARPVAPPWPISVLLLGSQALSDALAEPDGTPRIECERFDDASRLLELAHIVGPDIVVVDGDHPGAREAVGKLFSDERLEPTPVVVVGSFAKPEAAAAFVELGVARVLPKPCSPDTLRRTLDELVERAAYPRAAREPLGDIGMVALAERVASEFRRGLVDALESGAQNARVPLGDGHDVLAAVWGAVARVRELVTVRSNGSLRFQQTGPEGAVPIAPWTPSERRAGERQTQGARDAEGVSLQGRRIVVADDDPAVVWFMAGLLRAVGVEVLEAHDGRRALELAFERWPDAIVSDVLMPKLDGFSLCHEVKRDVAVRDVPVILLSWKEDLLQRVRELGAAADGYLRKEAAASAVVERVREILRARARVEERIEHGGEVRGRLDGLTPRLVLELACRGERDVRVSVRDAAFLFEAQIRKGRLVSLSRSAPDGSFLRGPLVLPSLLGASAGRFSVEPDASTCRAELSGSLFEILREPVAKARRALASVSADALLRLERVELERPLLEGYLACTPEPAAFITRRLLEGQSPRELVLSGAVSARLLEVVLSDVARRGALLSVVAGAAASSAPPPEPILSVEPPPAAAARSVATASGAGAVTDADDDAGWLALHEAGSAAPPAVDGATEAGGSAANGADAPSGAETAPPGAPASGAEAAPPGASTSGAETAPPGAPASGAETAPPGASTSGAETAPSGAETREHPAAKSGPSGDAASEGAPLAAALAEDASVPVAAALADAGDAASESPAVVVTARAVSPPREAGEPLRVAGEPAHLPLSDEVTPAGDGESEPVLLFKGAGTQTLVGMGDAVAEKPPAAATRDSGTDVLGLLGEASDSDASDAPLPRAAERQEEPAAEDDRAASSDPSANLLDAVSDPPAAAADDPKTRVTEPPQRDRAKTAPEDEPKGGAVGLALRTLGAGAIAFVVTTWLILPLFSSEPDAAAPTAQPSAAPAPPAVSAAPAPKPGLSVQDLEPPHGMELAPGQGLIEIETVGADPIYVDDAFVGLGPVRRVAAAAGTHRVELRGDKPTAPVTLSLAAGRRALVKTAGTVPAAPAGSAR